MGAETAEEWVGKKVILPKSATRWMDDDRSAVHVREVEYYGRHRPNAPECSHLVAAGPVQKPGRQSRHDVVLLHWERAGQLKLH